MVKKQISVQKPQIFEDAKNIQKFEESVVKDKIEDEGDIFWNSLKNSTPR